MILRIAAAVSLFAAGAAQACTCADLSRAAPGRVEDFFDQAERVVHARVLSLASRNEARIQVIESFKGSGEHLQSSTRSDAQCGFSFGRGDEAVYFVFGGLVNLCGRAAPEADLLARLRLLKAAESACEGVPRPPRPAVAEAIPEKEPPPYEPLSGADPEVALGIGHIRPVRENDRDNWTRRLSLPVFAAPERELRLWLTPGSVASDALVETGYETSSFIVLRARADGWMQIRFGGPLASGAGWVHRCHLSAATPKLEFQPWDRVLAAAPALYFRSWSTHHLRQSPSADAPVVASIPSDPNRYGLQPIEFRGDWARVRLSIPSIFCADDKPARHAVHEGWVRWRGARGPLLWYYTRGC